MKILFLTKRNDTYGFYSYCKRSSGLYNSVRMVVQALIELGYDAKLKEVIDGNCIDREVFKFKPDVVIIEALFVTPHKFDQLINLHPDVSWYVHLHSNVPFLALEGIAMEWLSAYVSQGVGVIANSIEAQSGLRPLLGCSVDYLPNVYIPDPCKPSLVENDSDDINIACFGAIRPLKNQLLQAMAAIQFARQVGRKCVFHINQSRVETGGDPVLKNLRKLFDLESRDSRLVGHIWHDHDEFMEILRSIDIGMQVSLSESFNIVTADYISASLPIVTSPEVRWVSDFSKADPGSINDIVAKMSKAWDWPILNWWNKRLLDEWTENAIDLWDGFFS